MIVQRVVMPVTGAVSWTVLGGDGAPLEPVESYLAYLAALERSPNTQRAYATSLKLWFDFLGRIERSWTDVDIDDVARFMSWLRAPADNVVVLDAGDALRFPPRCYTGIATATPRRRQGRGRRQASCGEWCPA